MMGKAALALDEKDACRRNTRFNSPTSTVSASPTPPKACAHPPSRSVLPKAGSLSSSDSDISTPFSSMDLEKTSWQEHEPTRSSGENVRSRDLENGAQPNRHERRRSDGIATRITYDAEDEVDEERQIQEKHTLRILLFLSAPCVLLSAINMVWACIALVITLLSQPIRLCAKRPTVGQQLGGLLSPTLNLQLRAIYTPLLPHANEDASYNSSMLLVGHLLSPFLSFFMMFAAWVLSVYWLVSVCVGDPAGQDKRDDGKETVLGLARWWEKWLMRGIKHEE